MDRRRTPSKSHDPAKAEARIQESIAHLFGRFEQLAGDLDGRLGRIERDVASGSLGQERLRTEMAEGRRDTGELRDGLSKLREEVERMQTEQPRQVAESAAHGAAQGAAQGAMDGAAPAMFAEIVRKAVAGRLARWGTFGVAILVVVEVFRDGPAVVRGIDAFWNMLKGLNP